MAGEFIDPTEVAAPRRGVTPPAAVNAGGFVDPTEQMQPVPASAPMAEAEPVPAGEQTPFNQRRDGWAGIYNKFLRTPAQEATAIITGAPADITDLVHRGAYEAARFAARQLEGRDIGPYEQKKTALPRADDIRSTAYANAPAMKAESSGGKIIQEALTAGIAAGPVGPLAMGLGAASGATSEAAGQATEGTSAEPWARLAGAFLPLGAAGLYNMRQRAPDVVRKGLDGATSEQLAQAQSLMDDAARAGTPITSAEAIAQVTGNKGSSLLAGQRYVENSSRESPGVAYLKRIMAGRAEGNRAAFDAEVPGSSRPVNEIAPKVQATSERAVDRVRQETNAISRPAYDATTNNPAAVLSPAGTQRIQANAGIANAIKGARADSLKYGDLSGSPDNSIRVLDAAKRYLDDLESTATQAGERTTQANIGKVRQEILDVADAEYPRYASARLIQTIRQKYVEEPLRRSPTGKMADAEKLTQQWETIFTRNPAEVSPDQVRDAVALIAKNDPALASDFVNRYLQRTFRMTEGKAADQSRVASRVERKLFSDDDVGANIEAALKALPDGNTRWASFRRLMDIFEAQGNRMGVNSATESNQVIAAQLKSGGVQGAAKLAAKPFSTVKEAMEWWRYGRNTEQLAKAITGDVNNLRNILLISPKDQGAAIKATALLQGANLSGKPSE